MVYSDQEPNDGIVKIVANALGYEDLCLLNTGAASVRLDARIDVSYNDSTKPSLTEMLAGTAEEYEIRL